MKAHLYLQDYILDHADGRVGQGVIAVAFIIALILTMAIALPSYAVHRGRLAYRKWRDIDLWHS